VFEHLAAEHEVKGARGKRQGGAIGHDIGARAIDAEVHAHAAGTPEESAPGAFAAAEIEHEQVLVLGPGQLGERVPDSAAQRRRQWLLTIGVDLVAFSVLHVLVSSGSLNFAALLVLPASQSLTPC
jgi:hypothetical protein